MQRVRTSLVLSFADKYSTLILYFLGTTILARILTPEDIGTYSVAYGIAGMAATLRDFGVSTYLIQEKELTEARFQSALGLIAISATGIGLALAALAGTIADFYGRPEMRSAIYILAANFLFIPFNSVTLAMLRRKMDFAAIYRMSLAGALASTVTSITFALLGTGFMCMAYANLANGIATSAIAYRQRPRQYRLRPRLVEWRRTASFGVFAAATQIVTEVGNRAPDLIIGRLLGLSAVGLFSRANGLVSMVTQSLVQPVMSVALSAFSQTSRGGDSLKPSYLHALGLLTSVVWPSFAFIGLMAYPIIRILFGSQWDEAVPLARLTCVGGAFLAITGLQIAAFQAIGAVRRNLVVTSIIAPLQVCLLLLAGGYNLQAVALATAGMGIASFCVAQFFLNGLLGLRMLDVLAAVAKSVALTIAAALPPAAIVMVVGDAPDRVWSSLGLSTVGAAIAWLAAVSLMRHPIRHEIHLVAERCKLAFASALR